MSLLRGPKFNSNHSTYIPDSEGFLQRLKKSDAVKKIFITHITPISVGARKGKLASVEGNRFVVSLRGRSAVQDFQVIANDAEACKQLILDEIAAFNETSSVKSKIKAQSKRKRSSGKHAEHSNVFIGEWSDGPKKNVSHGSYFEKGKNKTLGELFPELKKLKK